MKEHLPKLVNKEEETKKAWVNMQQTVNFEVMQNIMAFAHSENLVIIG